MVDWKVTIFHCGTRSLQRRRKGKEKINVLESSGKLFIQQLGVAIARVHDVLRYTRIFGCAAAIRTRGELQENPLQNDEENVCNNGCEVQTS